jgi:hypothetical protein
MPRSGQSRPRAKFSQRNRDTLKLRKRRADWSDVDRATTNGGFPLPPAGEPVRVVACHHSACAAETRVRLPEVLPARAVRRVTCQHCAQPYEPARVQVVAEDEAARPSRPARIAPPAPSWRWLTVPVAAVAVVAIMLALRGGDDADPEPSAPSATVPPAAGAKPDDRAAREQNPGAAGVPKDAQLVRESTFQLALPPGWERTAPSGGATFAAVAPRGEADVMLWIERDPKLDFASFEARSLDQLESIAGSAGVVERNAGPTPETSSVTIAPTSAPAGAPNYEVLLRANGDYWYYLATTSQVGAPPEVTDGVALVQGSFLPQGSAR